jgi:hypothetical protein
MDTQTFQEIDGSKNSGLESAFDKYFYIALGLFSATLS